MSKITIDKHELVQMISMLHKFPITIFRDNTESYQAHTLASTMLNKYFVGKEDAPSSK